MTGLHELRRTLDQHAHDIDDEAAQGRAAVVHTRVRRVRQQRLAGVGVAAALALVATVSVSLLPGDRSPRPTERELIGREAPATIESLGYTYAFSQGVESGEDRASVRLRRSENPRLITWAADADEVLIDTPYAGRKWSPATEFDDFMVVEGVESGRWTVRANGAEAAIAVYELTEDRPAGAAAGGDTFRERVGSERLLGSGLGEPGEAEVELEVTLPEGDLRLAEFCRGIPVDRDLWINTSVDGDGASSSSGCGPSVFDPGGRGGVTYDAGTLGEPGDTVSVRQWVSRRPDGPVVEDAEGIRLGLAAYAMGEPAAVVAGWDMPQLYEHGGQVWSFVSTELAEPEASRFAVRNTGPRAQLAVGSFRGAGQRGVVEFRHGPFSGVDRSEVPGGGSDLRAVLEPGGPAATLRVRGEASSRVRMGFALYERVG